MAFKKKNYPPYWKQFSEYIRFERAKNKCEKCGAQNGFLKISSSHLFEKVGFVLVDPNDTPAMASLESFLLDLPKKVSKIVLTVAHLDRWGDVCQCKRFFGFKCAKPSHVLALCQSCHLAYDRDLHIAVRRRTLTKKKDEQRGLFQII